MPTYEYECKSCGHSFEAFQSMTEDPLKDCPQCGKEIRRLINGGTGVIFRGSGFYVTDKSKGTTKTSSSASGEKDSGKTGEKTPAAACASCPASAASGGSCPASPPAGEPKKTRGGAE
ncbi:MAG: zinc ribbon domain-containing protein [Treponema sp.]|jgi:putative FmdB family regulatory protein|nr:zinc ribbon domain-containing protein [Treponema sp.]